MSDALPVEEEEDTDEVEPTDPAGSSRPWWGRWGRGLAKGLGVAAAAIVAVTVFGWLRAPWLPDEAPEFSLEDLDGKTVTLTELRGQPVLLNFWATWCGPCRIEAPSLSRFDQRHEDIVVIGIAADGTPAALRRASQELGITYRVLRADRDTLDAYGVSTLPTTVFVDARGQVLTSYTGMLLDPQLEAMAIGL